MFACASKFKYPLRACRIAPADGPSIFSRKLIIIITSAKSTFPTTIITTVETRLSHYYNLINYEVITIATMTDTNGSNHDSGIEAQRAKMSFLFREDVAPGLRLEMDLNRIFTSSESEFQQIDIVETYFGKVCL